LTDRNSDTRHLLAVRNREREQQINVKSHETASHPDEFFAQPFITKGFQLEIPEERPKGGGKDLTNVVNKENSDDENMDSSRPK